MPPHTIALTPAQRLRRLLGVQEKSRPRALQRHRHGVRVDALEPRVMLSAEWMALPGALDRQQTFVVEPSFTPASAAATFMPVIEGLSRQVHENKTNEVLFVDAGVQDSQQLVSDLLASRSNSQSPTFMDVVVLDAASDGLSQIGQWLSQRSDIRALHLISHGADGVLQLGSTSVDAQSLGQRAADVAAWSKALMADADFLIYGCDVAQTAAGQTMLQRLASLTGADVAASVDVTGGAAADWELEFHTGVVQTASLSALSYQGALAIAAADLKLGSDDTDTADANKVSLQEQWTVALTALESAMDLAMADTLVNQKLPGLNASVNEMLGLDSATTTLEALVDWQLAQTASAYFVSAGANANLAGLASAIQTHINTLIPSSTNLPWVAAATAQVLDIDGTPTARLGLEFSVASSGTRNFQIGTSGSEGGLPTINAFDGSEMGSLATELSAVVAVHIDMAMASLASGAAGASFLYEGAGSGSTAANSATFLVIERFDLGVHAQTGANAVQSFSFDLQAGIAARLRAADGSLGVTLTDWLAYSSDLLDVQRHSSVLGEVPAGTGSQDLTALKTSTQGLIGVVTDGVLTTSATGNVALSGNVATAFTNILAGMAKLGSQMDGQSQLNRNLPMVDLNYTQLLTMNDGRTLGDVLAFKLAGGGNVLTDYVASSSAPTLAGLIDRMRQYLSGTGQYTGLEAVMSAELAASFLSASGFSGSTATVRLNGTLSRQFMARFGFNGQLDDVGLAFALGQGVPMLETVALDLSWAVALSDLTSGATATSTTVTVSNLVVNVNAVDAGTTDNLDAAVVLGTLDARLQGSLDFRTEAVTLAVNGGAAMAVSAIHSVADINASLEDSTVADLAQVVSVTGSPQVYAAADMVLTGTFADYSLSDLAGGTPRLVTYHDVQQTAVADAFADGTDTGTLADALSNADWQAFATVDSDTLLMNKQNFAGLQKFAAINATDFAQLLGDVGYFLEQLRQSDQFATALPFTNTTLGEAVDFSALMNELIETQFKEIVNSGVSGTERVAPVLARDLGFTIKYQRPGDAYDTLIDVVIRAADTSAFTDVRQLAELVDKTIAQSMGGVMRYNGEGAATLPTEPSAEVTEQVQGGLTVADTVSNASQKMVLRASAGDYSVSLDGEQWSAPIAVHGSAKALQNALENLDVVGKGNVLVTGIGKSLTVEFIGDLAGQAMDLLQVRFETGATAGGWLNVVASDFQTINTALWGQINIVESAPGTYSKLEIRPNAGVTLATVTEGSSSAQEVQRITIVNGGGGSFALTGKFGTTAFTADVSLDGAGVWSTRIQDAIRTSLVTAGMDATEAAKVTVTVPVLVLPSGVQSFDVTFGTNVNQDEMTVDFADVLGRMGVGVAAYQVQAAKAGVGDTAASHEVQRVVFDNVSSGTFSLTLALQTKTVQTDDISWVTAAQAGSEAQAAAQMAIDFKAKIFAILKQVDEALTEDQIVVTAVTDVATGTRAFDVDFIGTQGFGFCNCESPGETLFMGDLQGEDVPQFQVNSYRLTAENANAGLDNLTALGFDAGGAELQQTQVTTFSSIMEVMARVQTYVNAHLPEGASFDIDPRYNLDDQRFEFDIKLVDQKLQSVGLSLPQTVGDASDPTAPGVTELIAEGSLDLSTEAVFEATIGIDFNELLPFDVVASGLPTADIVSQTALTAASTTAAITLTSPSALAFEVTIDNQTFSVSVPATTATGGYLLTSTTTSVLSLTTAIQYALDQLLVTSTSPLYALGVANLGDLVTVGSVAQGSTGFKLKFTVSGSIERFGLDAVSANMVDVLGFLATNLTYAGAPTTTVLPSTGVLTSDATFSFVFDVNAPAVSVTLLASATSSNTSRDDLIADINRAIAATSVATNAYLGTAGLGFANLGELVTSQLTIDRAGMDTERVSLGFITQTSKVASMEIRSAGDANAASTQLGIIKSQSSQTRGAEIYLQDVKVSGQWSTQMYDPTPLVTTDNNLKYEGSASLGMLSLDFGSVLVNSEGAFSFELRDDPALTTVNNGDRMVLNDLFDKVQVQSTQLGLGSEQLVKSKDITLVLPVVEDGKLNTDVALKLVMDLGGDAPVNFDVVIRAADAANNTTVSDLATDVNNAIQAALRAELTSDSALALAYAEWLTTMPTFVVGTSIGKPSTDLDMTNPALDDLNNMIDVLVLKTVTLVNQTVNWQVTPGRLASEVITPIVYTDAAGTANTSPTAELTLGKLAANGWWLFDGGNDNGEPSEAYALRDATTVVKLKVDNMAAVLAGEAPMALQSVVPPNGLGVYTPLKDVSWKSVSDQLSAIGDLFSNLDGMGANGVLAQALPMLNSTLSELFNFDEAFAGVQERLSTYKDVQLQDLKEMLIDVFGTTADAIHLNLERDENGVTTGLRIQLPYSVQVDLTDRFQWIFDPKLRALVANLQFDADGDSETPETISGSTFLTNLLGSMTGMGDDKGNAPTRLLGNALFQLDFGIDLSGTWKDAEGDVIPYEDVATSANTPVTFEGSTRFGQVYLMDREEDVANKDTRTGTRLDLALTTSTTGMAFDSNMGLFSARVNKGSLSMDVDAEVRIDSVELVEGTEVTRTWLSDYKAMVDEATSSSNARARAVLDVATLVDTAATDAVKTTVMLPLAVNNGVSEIQVLDAAGEPAASVLVQAGFTVDGVLSQLDDALQEQVSVSVVDVLNINLNTKVTSLQVVNAAEDGPQAWLDDLGQLQIERGANFQLAYNFRSSAGLAALSTVDIAWSEDTAVETLAFSVLEALNQAQTQDGSAAYSGALMMVTLVAQDALVLSLPADWSVQLQAVQTLLVDLSRDGRFGLTVNTGAGTPTEVVLSTEANAQGGDVLAQLQDGLTDVALDSQLTLQAMQLFNLTMPINVTMAGAEVLSVDDDADGVDRVWFDANGGLNVTGESAYRLTFDYSFRDSANMLVTARYQTASIDASADAVAVQNALNAALNDSVAYSASGNRALTATLASEAVYLLRAGLGVTVSPIKGRDLAKVELDAYRADRMAVDLDGSLHIELPMSVVFSSGLAKLAENAPEEMNLGDFINPMPVGTLVADYQDLGSWMAYKGGASYQGSTAVGSDPTDTLISVQLAEAIPPDPNANGNGTGDAPVPEGTPVDQDFEDQLSRVMPDPYRILTGTGLLPGGEPTPVDPGTPETPPAAPVYDIDLTLPNFKYWQDVAAQLIALSGADGCDPDEPENPGLLMLLRDPAQVVDTIDQILAQIQTQLNNLFGDISLPFIQSQLSGAIGFIDELRVDLLGALREAIESTYKMYGGVDNALRMFMFDVLTTDMNGDWVIDASDTEDPGYNLFLNFLRDFNGDGDITADDIVIEYLLTADSEEPPAEDPSETVGNNEGPDSTSVDDTEYAVDMADLSWSAGRRAAWVTSGMNEAILAMQDEAETYTADDEDGTEIADANAVFSVLQGQGFGDYHLLIKVPTLDANGNLTLDDNGDPFLTEISTQAIDFDASAEDVQQAVVLAMSVALPGIEITQDDVEVIALVHPDFDPEADPETAPTLPLLYALRLADSLNEKFAQYHELMFVPLEDGDAYVPLGDEQQLTGLIGFDYGDSCYTSHAGKVVLDASFDDNIEEMAGVWTGSTSGQTDDEKQDAVRQEVRGSVLEAANAIQFRMNLGQSYEFGQDLSFDLGLDAIPLELTMDGELVLEVKWDVFLGFGLDLDEGFYLVTRSMDHAGIGAVTDVNSADGYSANEDDEHIANLWAVEEEEEEDGAISLNDFTMDQFLGMFDAPEAAELPETEEIIISANVYLRGLDTDGDGEEDQAASLNGRLLFLGGQLTDLWTDTVKNTDAEEVEVSEDMAWGDEGKGSRTQLYAFFKIDITDGTGGDEEAPAEETPSEETPTEETPAEETPAEDPPADEAPADGDTPAEGETPSEGETPAEETPAEEPAAVDDGRLTFAKFMEADLTDLFETSWKALAQVNLNAKLGLSVGAPMDYLPTIQTEFHLYWGMGSEDKEDEQEDSKSQMAKLAEGLGFELPEGEEEPEYFAMFTTSPTIWFSDVRLDLGTFFTEFMMPIADRVFQVIGPLIPVIKALTTPIPGLSQLMGKDYTAVDLAVDMAKLFGGQTKIEFIVAVVKMVRTIIDMYEDVNASGGNFAIPISEILVLSAPENGDDSGDKPEVEVKGDKEKAVAEGENTTEGDKPTPKDTTDDLEENADSPGSALAFPFLDDLFGTTIDLLLGNPVDLVTFTPPDLVVEVKFRFGAKIFYIFDVGIYGSLKFGARLTFGYDTYGIMKFIETKAVLDIFDGFFVSDNVVNGVDLPEIFLETKIGVYVGLDLGIVKLGIVGGIKLTGGINLCDPDKDGKIRPSEFIMMIEQDPAAIVSVEVTLGAFILFYIEVLFLKLEFTIVDVVLFKWEYNPCDRQPILAVMDGTDLVFNTGSGIASIDGNAAIGQTAEDRRYRNTDDGNEAYTLSEEDGDIKIDAVLPNGQSYNQSFSGVQRVRGYAGAGNDVFDASAISTPVYFVGGDGDDVLIGGGGDDVLMGGVGTTLLQGGDGNDLLVARSGTTTLQGQGDNDTYRFLPNWGVATMPTDGSGRNVLDFTGQTQGVTVDDSARQAFQGGNTVAWAGGTTLDQMWGGQGDDRLDFSGDEANLLVTVTGMASSALNVNSYSATLMGRDTGWTVDNKTNAGWVTNATSGMQQTTLAAGDEQRSVSDQVGEGFKFVGFENLIGGQGSDVFRVRDGASVTGSLHGDTAQGLYHDASGNENANVRNTIDFSEYTDSVRVDQENYSAFGVADASRIVVRGMHNMFGGAASDYLAGDGRNNLIVGNDGADTLEGRSAHDLLVADNFYTWMNISGRPSNPVTVASYISLENVGQRAEFGGDGRRWVWLGQSLENRSLTNDGQTLRGGTGNDIQMGALGGDLFNDGGTAEGNDTIVADLGRMMVDFNYRTPLYVESFGRRGGGNDTVYLGTGSNIVIAGAGDDTVSGNDQADSFNIVMGDNGAIKFQSDLTDVGGNADNWSLRANLTNPDAPGYNNHMVDYIRTEQDEAPEDGRVSDAQSGQAGNDTINLSSGSGVVIGGWGADTITMSAQGSVESNTRYIAGDHAELIGDDNGGIVEFRTLDTVRANGGADFIQIGTQSDSVGRDLGRNYVFAGMSTDTVLISAGVDDTGVLRFGGASSEDVVLGDNGEMLRTESAVGTELLPNLMLRLQTIQNDKGDADLIALANGTKVVLGGVGADTIQAIDGDHLVLGDNGRLDYDSVADNGVLRTVTTTDIVIGGDDQITLGEGYTLVAGGKGNDQIEVSATRAGDATGLAVRDSEGRLRYVAGVLGVAELRTTMGYAVAAIATSEDIATDNTGRTGRFISGDNTVVSFDDQGGLIAMLSTDPIAATGGADSIRIGVANTSAYDLGLHAVVGGMGSDQIEISQVSVSSDVVMGDNGDYRRASRSYGLTSVVSTRTESGGADSIRTGAGDKILIGGFGADGISAATLSDVTFTGDTQTTAVMNRTIAIGDSGQALFDLSGAAALSEVSSLALSAGGNDTVALGDGDVTFMGGYGNDSLTVTPSKLDAIAMRVAFGDNASLRYAGIATKSAQAENLVQAQTLDQTTATGGSDTLTVGRAGATMGQVMLFGGMSADSLTVLGSTADAVLLGDNGLVTVAQVTTAPSVSGQQAVYWDNAQLENSVSMLTSIETMLPEQGTGDSLLTVNGTAVLIGGAGADRISAGRGQGVVFGDGAQVTYSDGALREARSFGVASGLGDIIELGSGSGADGHKVLVGGAGGDTLTLSSEQGTLSTAAGRIERALAGDNATLGFDAQGRLVTMDTPDADIATAGNDSLTILISGSDVDRQADAVFVAGGLGDDRIVVNASGKTVTVASGDNLQLTRTSGDYLLQSAIVSQPSKGGADTLRLGAGTVLAFGGVGSDQIDISSKAGDLVVAQGDAGYVLFEVGTSQEWLSQIGTSMETVGGNDTLSIGAGRVMALGGAGRDTLALRSSDAAQRVVLGDTGQIDFASGEVKLVQSTQDAADASLHADTFVLPSDGKNLVIGGAGTDTLSAIVNTASRYMPGSGMLESTDSGVQVVSVTVLGSPGEFGMYISADGVGTFPAISDDYALVRQDPAVGKEDAASETLELTLFGQGTVTVGQTLSADGRIAYPALRSGLATFAPVLLVGTYGTLDLRKDGSWAYSLAPGNASGYNAASTEIHTETFYLETTDGSVTTVVVEVRGAAKTLAQWITAKAVEDTGLKNDVSGVQSVGHVSLSSSGSFNGQVITSLKTGTHQGDFGSLSIDRDGLYTYTLDPSLADELPQGTLAIDRFANLYYYTDAQDATQAGTVEVMVVGGNDRPVLSLVSGSANTVTLDAANPQTRSGSLQYVDVDLGDVLTLSKVLASVKDEKGEELPLSDAQRQALLAAFTAARVNDPGTARLQGSVNWTFAPTPATLSLIPAGQTVSIRFELVLKDAQSGEHSLPVVVQAQGANDAPTFGGDLAKVMLASDGKLSGQATVADADVGEARFVAQVVNGQFGVFTMQTSGSWVYVLNANASVPPGTTLSERFELSTRDASGLGTRPVVNVYIKGPDLVVSAAGNAPAATPTPATAPASVAPAASAPASAQPLQSSPLDGGAGDAPLGPMSPYAAHAAKGVALPGSAPASQRTGSPSDPATQSSEPQQAQQPAAPAAAPADPAAPAPAGIGDQAAAEPSVEASPEQVVLLDELMNFADSGSGVLSAIGVAAAMTMGKGQRIQWQDSKKAQPSRQRIQW